MTYIEGELATALQTYIEGELATALQTYIEGELATALQTYIEGELALLPSHCDTNHPGTTYIEGELATALQTYIEGELALLPLPDLHLTAIQTTRVRLTSRANWPQHYRLTSRANWPCSLFLTYISLRYKPPGYDLHRGRTGLAPSS